MIELLVRSVERNSNGVAVIGNDDSISYRDLTQLAAAVAAGLQARSITRFAVVDYFAADHVAAILGGASLVGAEACLYPPADDLAEVSALADRFDHEVVVTDRADLPDDLRSITLSDLASEPGDLEAAVPSTRPHLVLTTGTTGEPKGIRHDWGRLVSATNRVEPAHDERWLLAYGLHQFGGLQLLLHVMAAGATLVAPVPRRPREGIRAMRDHEVTHVSATPTFWRFALAEMRAAGGDFPRSIRQITLGGEAVPPLLLDDLRAAFPDANISQVYAASEFGSATSVRDGRSGLPISLLDRSADADITVKIVDGELWVRSTVGMLGYYGEPDADSGTWRATGDMVEVIDDRIVFTGRKSDVINVGGVKVHPLPIEERVTALDGVAMARVFGRPNPMSGSIVAVEAVAAAGYDPDDLKERIRDACADLPAAMRPRSVKIVDSIATKGDKVVRGGA